MSSDNKFTPGPWEASGNGIWRTDNHNSIAFVTVYKPDLSPNSEAAATVRLIALAPEMYDVLSEILANDGMMPDTQGKINRILN